jgi:DNA repair exonuclease SbcCD ATPase subunit|tara:strand:+ start:5202 stop:6911 length:1710 start_codon:yes stop_codon:yes gene_type:complete
MIVFETLRWKNFLSTGNNFIELDLVKSPSTLVLGRNGAGKSTMLDALCFSLFNKPFRLVKKGQLVNSVNEKECVVEVEFKIGSVHYKVVRGIKPNVFEIYRNGSLIDQDAANNDYQKYLEQSILKLNYKSFTQVVILGSSTFVPFMQLSAPHRREVIEDLLDIQVFSRMNAILKDRVKDTKEEINECNHQLQLAQKEVDLKTRFIEQLEAQSGKYAQEKREKIAANQQRLSAIKNEVAALDARIVELEPQVLSHRKLGAEMEKLRELQSKINYNYRKGKKDLKFYKDHDQCPTCSQNIDADWKNEQRGILDERINKYDIALKDLKSKIEEVNDKVTETGRIQVEITDKRYTITSMLREENTLNQEINHLEEELNKGTPNVDKERDSLNSFLATRDEKQESCSQIASRFDNLKVVGNLLKDGGIKTKIINKFIPTINQRINKYLSEMDFFVNFTLDEEFKEVIKSRYRDVFSYASFSEGEKQKIDLALLFTWRSIAKLKNSTSCNLLILDEVFDSSLDSSATDELFKILKGLGDKTNLFIISHKGEILLDKFERTVTFDKPNDFSRMTEE